MVVFDGSTGYLAFKAERLLEAKREDHPSIRLSCASLRAAMAQMPASSVSGAMRASAAPAGLYFAIFPYAASAIAAILIDKRLRGRACPEWLEKRDAELRDIRQRVLCKEQG